MKKILENAKFPQDIKKLNTKELEILGEEIRGFLIEKVSKTGGHLASNLGVVDLTLSLFNFSLVISYSSKARITFLAFLVFLFPLLLSCMHL